MQKHNSRTEKIASLLHNAIFQKLKATSKFFDANANAWYEENEITHQFRVSTFDLNTVELLEQNSAKSKTFIEDSDFGLLLEVHVLICDHEIDVLFCEIDSKSKSDDNCDYHYQSLATLKSAESFVAVEDQIHMITEKANKIFLKTVAKAILRGFTLNHMTVSTDDEDLDLDTVLQFMYLVAIEYA